MHHFCVHYHSISLKSGKCILQLPLNQTQVHDTRKAKHSSAKCCTFKVSHHITVGAKA